MPDSRSRRAVLRSGIALGSLTVAGCLDGSSDGNDDTGNVTDGTNNTDSGQNSTNTEGGETEPTTVDRWPMYQHDAQNTGSVNASPPAEELEEVWSTNVGDPINTSPVVEGETAYTLDGTGTAYAIEDGDVLWSETLGGEFTTACPVIYEDLLLVPHSEGVFALFREDGTQQWKYSTEDTPQNLTVTEDAVIFADEGFDIYAIEAGSGEERWKSGSTASGAGFIGAPVIVDEDVYIKETAGSVRDDGPVVKVDVESGYIRPAFETEKPIITSMSARDGLLFAGSSDGLHAFGIDGESLWDYETNRPIAGAPSVTGETVYCFSKGGLSTGAAHAIAADDGSKEWVEEYDFPPDKRPLIVGDTMAFAGTQDKLTRIIDRNSGEVLSSVEGEFAIYYSMVYAKETYYVSSSEGGVHAYRFV